MWSLKLMTCYCVLNHFILIELAIRTMTFGIFCSFFCLRFYLFSNRSHCGIKRILESILFTYGIRCVWLRLLFAQIVGTFLIHIFIKFLANEIFSQLLKYQSLLTVVSKTPDLASLNALNIALRSCCVNEPCNLKTEIIYR